MDEMIIKLNKINKDLLGLIYYWFYQMGSLIIDNNQSSILNYLFDFFDNNKNISLSSNEFRDKFIDYHIIHINHINLI